MNQCQYCSAVFASNIQKTLHEQSYCLQKPQDDSAVDESSSAITSPELEPELVGATAFGHATDDEAHKKWEEDNNRVTRLQFFQPDPNFALSSRIIKKLERLTEQRKVRPQNILFLGDAGMGKTSAAIQYAALTKSPTLKCPCPAMTEVSQWMGRTEFKPEIGTHYIPSLFVEAVETPNSVIILNDITRVENPKVLNPLMDILDDTRAVWSEDLGRNLKVAPGVVFIATANQGWEYVGADDLDKALKERFSIIELGLPPEDIVRDVVYRKVGNGQMTYDAVNFFMQCVRRGIKMSFRHILRMCEDMKYGASLVDAALLNVLGDLTEEQKHQALQVLQVVASKESGDFDSISVEDKWVIWK